MKKTLNEILSSIQSVPDSSRAVQISGITQDSRKIQAGDLFVARKGLVSDGRLHIEQAFAQDAHAVIADDLHDEFQNELLKNAKQPIIFISDLNTKMSEIAGNFYDHPSKELNVIGVTGTNGKTSVSLFINAIANLAGEKSGLIGTLGYGSHPPFQELSHTTPDAIELQRIFYELKSQGIRRVVMEVSSHALDQDRVKAIAYHTGIFTNLTQDHLDYHRTMEHYGQAKAKLFKMPTLKRAIINSDDEFGRQLHQEFRETLEICGYTLHSQPHFQAGLEIKTLHSHLSVQGIAANILTPWGDGVLHAPLIGRFNLSNILAVIALYGLEGMPLSEILLHLKKIPQVPGRMERYGGEQRRPMVVIDYAHTPDALKQTLTALREHAEGKIWCVFGCGGDRDRSKRPLMGQIAEVLADVVIVTNDNPRSEDPAVIADDIYQGFVDTKRVLLEPDRHRAIEHAIRSAQPEDIVLIAGKGHETYQIIGKQKLFFSDAMTAQLILSELI